MRSERLPEIQILRGTAAMAVPAYHAIEQVQETFPATTVAKSPVFVGSLAPAAWILPLFGLGILVWVGAFLLIERPLTRFLRAQWRGSETAAAQLA
jgi:hypothetical protein